MGTDSFESDLTLESHLQDRGVITDGMCFVLCVSVFGGLSVEAMLVSRSLAWDGTAFAEGWLSATQHKPSLVIKLRSAQQSISQQRIPHMSLLT